MFRSSSNLTFLLHVKRVEKTTAQFYIGIISTLYFWAWQILFWLVVSIDLSSENKELVVWVVFGYTGGYMIYDIYGMIRKLSKGFCNLK